MKHRPTYQDALKQVAATTDRLGNPVDHGIRHTVAALMASGFPTVQSCQGHLKHSLPYPWVDIELDMPSRPKSKNIPDDIKELKQLLNTFLKKSKLFSISSIINVPDHKEAYDIYVDKDRSYIDRLKKNDKVQKKWRKGNLELQSRMMKLLALWYTTRDVPYEVRLMVCPYINHSSFRLQNMGGSTVEVLSIDEQRSKLKSYQNEMNAFADWLVERL